MPPMNAYRAGVDDGLYKRKRSDNGAGYPDEYEKGYRAGLLDRSAIRANLFGIGTVLTDLGRRIQDRAVKT